MKLRHVGYACINRSLERTTGRTLRLANLEPERVIARIDENLDALRTILAWNVAQGLQMFRISSSLIPFASHPEFPIDWRERFAGELEAIRSFASSHELRLSMHPGQYTVLNSPKPGVVERSVAELVYHGEVLEALTGDGGDIVVHIGGAYGDKAEAMARFARRYEALPEVVRRQLVLENDDTIFDVDDVLAVCRQTGCPLVFDIFHHQCNPPGDDWREGLVDRLASVVETWGRVPKCHISSARQPGATAHAERIDRADFETFVELLGQVDGPAPFDLMVEAKAKEEAALELLQWRL